MGEGVAREAIRRSRGPIVGRAKPGGTNGGTARGKLDGKGADETKRERDNAENFN